MTGEIFDIKRFAVHDGPGIRCTAFLKGCPLECVWCHNPEGKRPGPEISVHASACIGCGACVAICPSGAVQNPAAIDRRRCVRCGKCAAACPANALECKSRILTADELVAEFEKDRVFFETSGGGVTLSGGDPLFQPEFAREVLERAKARGFHTAVETCLYATEEVVEQLTEVVDLWLCDLKFIDESMHLQFTGRSNRLILANHELLTRRGCDMLTRIPVIPGCTDRTENLIDIARYLSAGREAELMFYNPLGQSKYGAYGMEYGLEGRKPYSEGEKEEFRRIVEGEGVRVV